MLAIRGKLQNQIRPAGTLYAMPPHKKREFPSPPPKKRRREERVPERRKPKFDTENIGINFAPQLRRCLDAAIATKKNLTIKIASDDFIQYLESAFAWFWSAGSRRFAVGLRGHTGGLRGFFPPSPPYFSLRRHHTPRPIHSFASLRPQASGRPPWVGPPPKIARLIGRVGTYR